MCGILSVVGDNGIGHKIHEALDCLCHRGPDARGIWESLDQNCVMGHRRLSIIDLTKAGNQPMSDERGNFHIVLNGEIYNYIELRAQLKKEYDFKSQSDTEVLLNCFRKWGKDCLERIIGMFSFAVWDDNRQSLFVARDRFGVKPLYYALLPGGELAIASEIKVLHKLGVPYEPDDVTWATYLTYGVYDHSERTFWKGINSLPPGHAMEWHENKLKIWKWYELAERVKTEFSKASDDEVVEEYRSLLKESVRMRFRSDVPVGISLSGGLDSCMLLGIVHLVQGESSDVSAYTYVTGDKRYDELPLVKQVLEKTEHPHNVCLLTPEEVPDLALKVYKFQDEPFGGLPTLAYSKVFETAKAQGTKVLLDGQGIDEQWAGYDYYIKALYEGLPKETFATGPVQGSRDKSVYPECLLPEFSSLAEKFISPLPFPDPLRNLQYRDTCYAKIPRAVRFSDRVSMMHSTELREPFLDHRLLEFAYCQPPQRKIRGGVQKWLIRELVSDFLPAGIYEVPKRHLQTPQREWLRDELREWVSDCINTALEYYGGVWLDKPAVLKELRRYQEGFSDNSFYIFQWLSLGLMCQIYGSG